MTAQVNRRLDGTCVRMIDIILVGGWAADAAEGVFPSKKHKLNTQKDTFYRRDLQSTKQLVAKWINFWFLYLRGGRRQDGGAVKLRIKDG